MRSGVAKCMRRDHLKCDFNEFSFSLRFHVKFSTTFTRDTNKRIKCPKEIWNTVNFPLVAEQVCCLSLWLIAYDMWLSNGNKKSIGNSSG